LKFENYIIVLVFETLVSREEKTTSSDLFVSIFFVIFISFVASSTLSAYIIEPFMRDGSIHNRPRFTINHDALETIANDKNPSVIAIGSSMIFKGLDGGCVSTQLDDNISVYNLGQVMSRPYTDMLHIPGIVNAKPDLVLVEIGPNLLFNTTGSNQLEYVELRFKLDSMYQTSVDVGGWIELIEPEHRSWLAMNEFERMKFRQEYVPKALEERLLNLLMDETFRPEWIYPGLYGWVPESDSSEWKNYLQTPIFPDDSFGFDGMSKVERDEYNLTHMKGASGYHPINNSQSHLVLDYEINILLESGIKVMIVTPPQHPSSLDYVEAGQWDILNETIDQFLQLENVSLFSQLWEQGWEDDHFYDRNHLDDEGRVEFCQRLAPAIEEVMDIG